MNKKSISKEHIYELFNLSEYIMKLYHSDDEHLKKMHDIFIAQLRATLDLTPKPTALQLKSYASNVLTSWNESSGADVDKFWELVQEKSLPFERKDYLTSILKRNKISNAVEYHFVIDGIVVLEQTGKISSQQVIELNKMIKDYEERRLC
jgi:hypothetical protein